MPSRWLAMVALFALGFGSACLVKVGKAQDEAEQWFDDDFVVVDGGEDVVLENRSHEKGYVTVVTWKTGSGMSGGTVTGETGPVTVSKDNVAAISFYRLEPVGRWESGGIFRPCDPPALTHCPIPGPPPPPPEPTFDTKMHWPQ